MYTHNLADQTTTQLHQQQQFSRRLPCSRADRLPPSLPWPIAQSSPLRLELNFACSFLPLCLIRAGRDHIGLFLSASPELHGTLRTVSTDVRSHYALPASLLARTGWLATNNACFAAGLQEDSSR
jgi:hypothetical protein